MKSVLVLGNNGMLGSMVSAVLRECGHKVFDTNRAGSGETYPFVVGADSIEKLIASFSNLDYIINAIGVIKPRINEAVRESRMNAIQVNSLFPHELAEVVERLSIPVIQIATDCVYSGTTGLYDENSPHDPTDIYGKSKSLGEVPSNKILHLRASIIGPEVGRQTSLWEWVRSQPNAATLNGFTNHLWNGVTTFHFARVCEGIIANGIEVSGLQHLVPEGMVTKAELVREIAQKSNRADLVINDVAAAEAIDRTLSTTNLDLNAKLWSLAGYGSPPTVPQMVHEVPLSIS